MNFGISYQLAFVIKPYREKVLEATVKVTSERFKVLEGFFLTPNNRRLLLLYYVLIVADSSKLT